MSTKTKLAPRQRLSRGLSHTAAGPVDVTRGLAELGANSALSGMAKLRHRYQQSRLAQEVAAAPDILAKEFATAQDVAAAAPETLAKELAAAQDVVAGLPQALQQARKKQRRNRRPWLIAGVAVLAGGGLAAVVIARRSSQRQQPSPQPGGVDARSTP